MASLDGHHFVKIIFTRLLILFYICTQGAASVARAWTANFDSLISNRIEAAMRDCCSMEANGLADYPDLFSMAIIMLLTGELEMFHIDWCLAGDWARQLDRRSVVHGDRWLFGPCRPEWTQPTHQFPAFIQQQVLRKLQEIWLYWAHCSRSDLSCEELNKGKCCW